MISRELLADGVKAVTSYRQRGGAVSRAAFKNRIRVGFNTAGQILEGLEAARVLGPLRDGRRPILVRDEDAGHRLVAEAIEDGRIELTPVGTAPDPSAVDRG